MTDIAVVGGGLAGCAVAWHLHFRGVPFTLFDRGEAAHPFSASRVAAGLLTPVTGQRPALTWRLDDLAPAAWAFYRRVEALTGRTFFHPGPTLRIPASAEERERLLRFADHVTPVDDVPEAFATPFGAVALEPAARLDVPAYLRATAAYFAVRGQYEVADVTTPPGGRVVWCTGFADRTLPFAASKGEILTLRVPGLTETRTVNRLGRWLTNVGPELYRAGSTYDRAALDDTPTAAGREAILAKLSQVLRSPVEVVGHVAGVRPIVHVSRPVVEATATGIVVNGLGSKGALTAPYFAAMVAAHLVDGTPLDPG
jgi:glycine oxidase